LDVEWSCRRAVTSSSSRSRLRRAVYSRLRHTVVFIAQSSSSRSRLRRAVVFVTQSSSSCSVVIVAQSSLSRIRLRRKKSSSSRSRLHCAVVFIAQSSSSCSVVIVAQSSPSRSRTAVAPSGSLCRAVRRRAVAVWSSSRRHAVVWSCCPARLRLSESHCSCRAVVARLYHCRAVMLSCR
jgi:hypothetical protein